MFERSSRSINTVFFFFNKTDPFFSRTDVAKRVKMSLLFFFQDQHFSNAFQIL